MSTNQRDNLRAAIANARSFQDQVAAVTALDEYDRHQAAAHQAARDVDWADTTVQATLAPATAHERSTMETDWLGEYSADNSPQAHHAAMAEVAMWYGRTSPEVKADREEFGTQAEGFVRRVASAYGEQAEAIRAEALTYLGFLHRQAASGLDQVQQTVDSHENPKTTPLDPTVFDNFADEVHPINAGVVGTETSERNPLLQEIEQEGAGQGQSEVPGGHSTGNEPTGPSAPFGNTVADSGPLGFAQGSVAINHTMTLDDFIKAEAASGLDQVQQVVDSQENPKPTPLNDEVQFPWLIGPDAYGNGGDKKEKDVEHSASRLPFVREANGSQDRFDHPEYDEHYQRGYDQSGHYGEEYGEDHPNFEHDPYGVVDLTTADRGAASPTGWKHSEDAFEDGWLDRAAGRPHGTFKNTRGAHNEPGYKESALKRQADMFGNSTDPHQVAGPGVANTPDTTPNASAGYQDGVEDALSGKAPTVADASSSVPPNVADYSKGYGDGAQERKEHSSPAKDFPVSVGGDNGQADTSSAAMSGSSSSATASRVSDRFVKAASRENGDFTKAYAFASKWAPGKPLVTLGSAQFEAGLYAGLVDNPAHLEAWRTEHRRLAKKGDEGLARRIATMDSYTDHLADHGIDVTAGTTTDLDTMDNSASPSATGQTPINGPGTPPPLEGGVDPARPGGPAPYNGAAPAPGQPVVPTGVAPDAGSGYINDVPGGPADGNAKALAFRRQVQAGLLAVNKQRAEKG